ncbi:MAG: glycoside hydrolase family 57 protein [Myxococcota bacterium]
MPSVCFYFQVHQPHRLRPYGVFDVGRRHDYFDAALDEAVLRKVAEKCYRPMNALLLELIERTDGRFKAAFSITGCALDQMARFTPDVVESFQRLVETGSVEILGETDQHSLSFLASEAEFEEQVARHSRRMQSLFGRLPRVFRNTELIYSNALARKVEQMGFTGVLAEGADRLLGWRSPCFVYAANGTHELPVLLKSYRLSDDIAFRFGNRAWEGWPLTAEKFAGWLQQVNGCGETINLFMDYETFGEHQWRETGIFEFMRALPEAVLAHAEMDFATPSEVLERHPIRGVIDAPEFVSWADSERDLTAWLGNPMQRAALDALFALREPVIASGDPALRDDFRKLTTSDHFYYMCTKYFADGDVHKYFSPWESPYEAHIAFMNVVTDLARRARADVAIARLAA